MNTLAAANRLSGIGKCVLGLLALLLISQGLPAADLGTADLRSLLLGPEEVPWESILWDVQVDAGVARYKFETLRGIAPMIEETWLGEPCGEGDDLRSASSTVTLTVAIAPTHELAVAAAQAQVRSVAVPPTEVTGALSPLQSVDRCWRDGASRYGAGYTFVKGNAIVQLRLACKTEVDPDAATALAVLVLQRLAALTAGRPMAAPLLPPSAAEMKVDLDGAWAARRALGPKGTTTIGLAQRQGEPRTLPAKRLAANDYLVPLTYLAGILGATEKPRLEQGLATVKVAGRTVCVKNGGMAARVANRPVTLSQPAQVRYGQALVPLSILKAGWTQGFAWTSLRGVPVARLK